MANDNPPYPYELTNIHFDTARGLLLIDYADIDEFDNPERGVAMTKQIQVRIDATDDIRERLLELIAAGNDIVQFAEELRDGRPRFITGG